MSTLKPWSKLGELTGREAQAVYNGKMSLARLILGGLSSDSNSERSTAWSGLPMVVRLRVGGHSQQAKKRFPWKTFDVAPPRPNHELLSKNRSYLLLDTVLHRLVVVLFDWDTLKLNRVALENAGISADSLFALLENGSRRPEKDSSSHEPIPKHAPIARDGSRRPEKESSRDKAVPARWRVVSRNGSLVVDSGDLDGSVSPIVGKIALGPIEIDQEDYDVEVLALPRLSGVGRRKSETIILADSKPEDPACTRHAEFLGRTVWATGNPRTLLGMLRLAHRDSPLEISQDLVRLSTDDDPSPLVWLALADSLERAAEHQRRTYVRTEEVRRAPVGTVRMGAWMNHIARQRPDQVPVTRFCLSADSPENRLFRGMAHDVGQLLRQRGALGDWMAQRFEHIEAKLERATLVEPSAWMCEALLQGELPAPVKTAVEHCYSVLSSRYPGLDPRAGAVLETRTFELDLAQLFEAAMRQLLRELLGDQEMEVVDGSVKEIPHAITWKENFDYRSSNRLKPDLAIRTRNCEDPSALLALGDVKYKRIRGLSSSAYSPLGRSDFQQLMTYMLAWPTASWGLVLMPCVAETDDGSASRQIAELNLPDGRTLGVFQVSAARWCDQHTSDREPLTLWVNERLREQRGDSSRESGTRTAVRPTGT